CGGPARKSTAPSRPGPRRPVGSPAGALCPHRPGQEEDAALLTAGDGPRPVRRPRAQGADGAPPAAAPRPLLLAAGPAPPGPAPPVPGRAAGGRSAPLVLPLRGVPPVRSEEHTSELQ